jgi:hypothetical protein
MWDREAKARWQKAYMPAYMRARRRLLNPRNWDKVKYPNREAWKRAMLRCESMRKYAMKWPHLVKRRGFLKDWDFEWQYRLAVEKGIREGSKKF